MLIRPFAFCFTLCFLFYSKILFCRKLIALCKHNCLFWGFQDLHKKVRFTKKTILIACVRFWNLCNRPSYLISIFYWWAWGLEFTFGLAMKEFTKDDFELDSEITSRLLTEIRNKYMKVNGGSKKQANGQIMSRPILKMYKPSNKTSFPTWSGISRRKGRKGESKPLLRLVVCKKIQDSSWNLTILKRSEQEIEFQEVDFLVLDGFTLDWLFGIRFFLSVFRSF